jgi:hypothetical protein
MGLMCFECKCEIAEGHPRFMYGIERPYTNLWFHRECWDRVKGDIKVYLSLNRDRVYNYNELLLKTRKNAKK